MHDVIDDSALVRITNSSSKYQELKAVSAWNCEERLRCVGPHVRHEGGRGDQARCKVSSPPPPLPSTVQCDTGGLEDGRHEPTGEKRDQS